MERGGIKERERGGKGVLVKGVLKTGGEGKDS